MRNLSESYNNAMEIRLKPARDVLKCLEVISEALDPLLERTAATRKSIADLLEANRKACEEHRKILEENGHGN